MSLILFVIVGLLIEIIAVAAIVSAIMKHGFIATIKYIAKNIKNITTSLFVLLVMLLTLIALVM